MELCSVFATGDAKSSFPTYVSPDSIAWFQGVESDRGDAANREEFHIVACPKR